ncbi:hypothetical protein AB0M54_45120 [Actinoplanes sp. NPDC051470]|uniref:hypothetical protein n=1 Tax=unclassified Actinoplanes TaxID=2626549 RepID=UPI003447A2A8
MLVTTGVRPHYRRNTPRAVQSTGHVRVSAHHRTDGTYVRSHHRSVDPVLASPTSTESPERGLHLCAGR